MSCKICRDHARLAWTNVQKSYKSNLARILQELPSKILQECSYKILPESYKICKKRLKILPDSCQVLDKILHDISSRALTSYDANFTVWTRLHAKDLWL